jgi:hypothetical protein
MPDTDGKTARGDVVARFAGWEAALLGAAFVIAASFEAVVIPYRNWDALDTGSWSRTIADGGFYRGVYDFQLHRPLFYVGQGLLWLAIGYHPAAGRLLSLAFTLLLGACLWILAGRLTNDEAMRRLARALSLVVLLSCEIVLQYVSAGLTDIPVAATAALTAVLLTSRLGRARIPLVALGAAATVLAKPSGLLALAGIVLAACVFLYDEETRRAAATGLLGIAAGIALALVYDGYEAHRLGEGLYAFLSAGANWDYWRIRAASTRTPALLGAKWLGAAVSIVVVHGLVFGVARLAGARLRFALLLAAIAALLWSFAGPMLADGTAPRPLQDAPSLLLLGYLALAAALFAAPYLGPQDDPISRRTYGALLLWAAPGALSWILLRSDEPRLLSPAWPALVLLAAASLAVVVRTLARRSTAAALGALCAVGLIALTTLPSIDGFDRASWRALLDRGPDGWDRTSMEQFAWGPFYDEVASLRGVVRPGDRIVSEDGRLRSLFPGQIQIAYPRDCAQLSGARAFVLLLDGPARFVIRANGGTASPRVWEACRRPALRRLSSHAGSYVVFGIRPTPAD